MWDGLWEDAEFGYGESGGTFWEGGQELLTISGVWNLRAASLPFLCSGDLGLMCCLDVGDHQETYNRGYIFLGMLLWHAFACWELSRR